VFTQIKNITEKLEDGQVVAGIYLDVAKAFDTVDHNILLYRLQQSGISEGLLKWFRSYLVDRTQMVKICNHFSDEIRLSGGVPQGGMLGPLLFLVYINSIFSVDIKGSVFSFADDTAIVCSAPDVVKLRQVVLENLNKIHNWFKQNKLKLNYQKTKILHYKFKNSDQNLENVKIDFGSGESYNLEIENTTKYLGVILDSKLTWENHVLYT